jgi:hypothetical protein
MDPRPERDRPFGRGVRAAGAFEEFHPGLDRRLRMPGARHAAEEQPDDLVSDQLVHQAIVGQDRRRPDVVEARQEVVKSRRRQPFAEACRPANVGEQQRDRDLRPRPPHAGLREPADAVLTDRGVAGEAPEPEVSQERPARRAERGHAQLAAWRGWDASHPDPHLLQAAVLAGEDLAELLRLGRLGHARTVRPSRLGS